MRKRAGDPNVSVDIFEVRFWPDSLEKVTGLVDYVAPSAEHRKQGVGFFEPSQLDQKAVRQCNIIGVHSRDELASCFRKAKV
ncbi:hypothetical protein EH32_10515 [Erythrobacter litoralis]|uniref:Uncharacterized protein n=1 Tax=Erythrobacter litoralis TaxID=39960 RepID=A0A074MV61_9SPHN|nr:hypothetical protein EH32_10515 [Erythrobacter litoralis]